MAATSGDQTAAAVGLSTRTIWRHSDTEPALRTVTGGGVGDPIA